MELEQLKDVIFQNGIVGAGGAGFPTHVKLSDKADRVILNCAECEPLLRVDRQLLAINTEKILKALSTTTTTLNAEKGIIAVKSVYKNAIEAVKQQLYKYSNLELKILPNVYPAGDEVVLVYETTGRIVPEGGIPLEVGALVINVETAYNVYEALFNGIPVIDKYVTINGAVKNPITLKVPIGISIKELINYAGGPSIKDYEILMGGPMTGRLVKEDDVVTKTTKAILVLPADSPVIKKRHERISLSLKRAMSVCSQCQMCTDLCPRNLLNHHIQPHKVMNAVSNKLVKDIDSFTMTMLCCSCGVCEMYACHQGLSPKTLIAEMKNNLRKNNVKNPYHNQPSEAKSVREGRLVPMSRLISRLALTKYNDQEAPLEENPKLNFSIVNILLSQHIGIKAQPVVSVGNEVIRGQIIGEISNGKLGAKLHSSINGKVIYVDNKSIVIEGRGE